MVKKKKIRRSGSLRIMMKVSEFQKQTRISLKSYTVFSNQFERVPGREELFLAYSSDQILALFFTGLTFIFFPVIEETVRAFGAVHLSDIVLEEFSITPLAVRIVLYTAGETLWNPE